MADRWEYAETPDEKTEEKKKHTRQQNDLPMPMFGAVLG